VFLGLFLFVFFVGNKFVATAVQIYRLFDKIGINASTLRPTPSTPYTLSTRVMTKFRPCIDIHNGQVKQIVGGSLTDDTTTLKTNFTSTKPAEYYSKLYKLHSLRGGHVIKLSNDCDEAAKSALGAWKDGLHIGGGINLENAQYWINCGAEKVIVTSWLFPNGKFSLDKLKLLSKTVGRDRLVVDLSCRRRGDGWIVAMNKWQTMTDLEINADTLATMAEYCSEYLVHAADVEGKQQGIDGELVACLAKWSPIPCTYAGGANSLLDLQLVRDLSDGRVDLTYGSALDIFGGKLVKFDDLVRWNNSQ
jgi:phosphoribosylformimino-5-aminoimidazole carboxamide ribotide isomerase